MIFVLPFIQENMATETRLEIINEIINKGGLLGRCARLYENDEVKANQFIIECREQCHNKFMLEYFGRELVTKIINYEIKTD